MFEHLVPNGGCFLESCGTIRRWSLVGGSRSTGGGPWGLLVRSNFLSAFCFHIVSDQPFHASVFMPSPLWQTVPLNHCLVSYPITTRREETNPLMLVLPSARLGPPVKRGVHHGCERQASFREPRFPEGKGDLGAWECCLLSQLAAGLGLTHKCWTWRERPLSISSQNQPLIFHIGKGQTYTN